MKIYNRLKPFQLFSFFIPVKWNGLLLFSTLGIAYWWLKKQTATAVVGAPPEDAYTAIFILLVKILGWFLFIFVLFAFLTSFIPYMAFWTQKRNNTLHVLCQQSAIENNAQQIELSVHPVWKPFLGFVRFRLLHDVDLFSDKFSLVPKKQNSNTISGSYKWALPNIKEYHLHGAIIYFEDVFQIFSFTSNFDLQSNFIKHPVAPNESMEQVQPKKTEEETIRIEELRRVQGEYLSYKNFEDNDDVRRIVWKIYAKSKELVVRIPETMSPYASHIYLYVSFFNDFSLSDRLATPMLDYYKAYAWAVYQQLQQQGFEVRFVGDQNIVAPHAKEVDNVLHKISVSHWHQNNDLEQYVQLNNAAVVLTHSLSSKNDVQQLVQRSNALVLLAPLTQVFDRNKMTDWMRWVFVQEEKDANSVNRSLWNLSKQKNAVVQNEKDLQLLVEETNKTNT
jgi:hypothetical protein